MAVEMIDGPRLCEPLLATGLGRFTGAASRQGFAETRGFEQRIAQPRCITPLNIEGLAGYRRE